MKFLLFFMFLLFVLLLSFVSYLLKNGDRKILIQYSYLDYGYLKLYKLFKGQKNNWRFLIVKLNYVNIYLLIIPSDHPQAFSGLSLSLLFKVLRLRHLSSNQFTCELYFSCGLEAVSDFRCSVADFLLLRSRLVVFISLCFSL